MTGGLSRARLRLLDPSGMLDTVLDLPRQVAAGWRLPRPLVGGGPPSAVAVLGMGGSAIGGDLLSSILLDRGDPPVLVNRDGALPAHVGPETLVFAASYSGETEETLAACRSARRRGCRVVTLSSGGRLARLDGGRRHVMLPAGFRPREALAFLLMPMLGVLEDLGAGRFAADAGEAAGVLSRMRADLAPERAAPANAARAVALALRGRSPAVLSGPFLAPAGRRWRAQLAENAKVLSRGGVLPELAHNDLAAWLEDPEAARSAVVLLRDAREDRRSARRWELLRRLGLGRAGRVIEVRSRGRGAPARLLSSVYVGDLASVYLAFRRGIDPGPVEAIDRFKRGLAGGRA
jgi:glucose/mannose-6-phosphate isomerase